MKSRPAAVLAVSALLAIPTAAQASDPGRGQSARGQPGRR
jgi:hypothetical protein